MAKKSEKHKQCQKQAARHCFTLVELLAAMGVLVILMMVLFRFLQSAEKAWSVASSTTEVYEKARIAFDVITQDLQGAVASSDDLPGGGTAEKICFEQDDEDELLFVTTSPLSLDTSTVPTIRLSEVGYQFGGTSGSYAYTFRRARENCTNSNCNIYDVDRDYDHVNDQNGFQVVLDGVLELKFVCYDANFTEVTDWGDDSGSTASYETGLPSAVGVTLKLLDKKSFDAWLRYKEASATDAQANIETQYARTFSKIIFLGGRG